MGDNNQDLWQCDGCGVTGTEAEVEAHVVAVSTLADGTLKPEPDVTCWGAMLVGGRAWDAFEFEGVHPMQTFVIGLKEALR